MKYLGITQARASSTRLPGKIFKQINNITMLELHIQRIKESKKIEQLIIAIADEPGKQAIIDLAMKNKCDYVVGSLENVLERFYIAAEKFKPENVIRFTSDCPLIDAKIIDQTIKKFEDDQSDYTSNCLTGTWPDGMDCEVFKMSALQIAYKDSHLQSEKEHVTLFIRNHPEIFQISEYTQPLNWGQFRMTLDTPSDFEVIRQLIEIAGVDADCETYVNTLIQHKEIFNLNAQIVRNEGLLKSLKEDKYVK